MLWCLRYASGETDRETGRQSDTYRDTLNAILGTPTVGEVK